MGTEQQTRDHIYSEELCLLFAIPDGHAGNTFGMNQAGMMVRIRHI